MPLIEHWEGHLVHMCNTTPAVFQGFLGHFNPFTADSVKVLHFAVLV